MTTTDQTPDAVRAAMAEDDLTRLTNKELVFDFLDAILERQYADPKRQKRRTAEAKKRLQAHGDEILRRLAQMGALRAVGEGVSKAELRAAAEDMFSQAHHCSYLQEPDKWTNHTRGCNDGDHRLYALIDRLPIPDTAARAGDGAT